MPSAADIGHGVGEHRLENPVAHVVTLLDDNITSEMLGRASAAPGGGDVDWRDRREHQIEITKQWTSLTSQHGIVAPSLVRVGCVWSFGGRRRGRGRYLCDAYLYAVVDTAGIGQRFSCTGAFEPSGTEDEHGVATLDARVTLVWQQFGTTEAAYPISIQIRGDGAGLIEEVTGGSARRQAG